jgi:YegS/Rv2252/BmrU family lipid kinase
LDQDVVLVVNGRARRGREWFERVRSEIARGPLQLRDSVLAHSPVEAEHAVVRALAQGVRLLAVGGGDGTFTHLVGRFMRADAVLGVLPLGTGNAFARDLGIVAQPEEAARVLWEGEEARVDLGTVQGDDVFLNVVTVGLTTRIAEGLDTQAKRRYGRLAYLAALSRALVEVQPFHATVETAEGTFEFDSLQVVIGNGRFHAGPFPLSPEAAIDEGRLSIYALKGRSRSGFVRMALRLWSGRHVELDEVFAIESRGGRLATRPAKRVTVDGEIPYRTPIKFGIRPGALRVMRPRQADG